MKTLWIVLFALAGLVVHGQGTILFSNRAGVLDAPVRNAAGELVPTNSIRVTPQICMRYYAELLVGSGPDSVAPFSTSIARTFSQPGYFGVGDPRYHFPVFHREVIPGLWCECCVMRIFVGPSGRLTRTWWNMVILPLSSWIHPVPDWEMERRRRQPRSWTVFNPFAWRAIPRGWGLRGSSEPTSC